MSSKSASAAPTGQAHTPSDLKWLLNERAALKGQSQRSSERRSKLKQQVERAALALEAARSKLAHADDLAAGITQRIDALDSTIALLYPAVNPAAGGSVNAWAGRFGERGALTAFVREHLQSIAPYSTKAADIQRQAIAHFGLALDTPHDRFKFKNSLRTVLRQLRDDRDQIESFDNYQGKRNQPLWRWKQHAPTLDDLRRQAAAAAEADERVSYAHQF